MVNNVEFLKLIVDIQNNMENMASKEDLVMISSKEDFQEVKAMLNEIRHRIIPNSYP